MQDARSFFSAKLAHETDASDVYAARRAGEDLVLVDVRSAAAWDQGHISGAIHLPYRDIAERASELIPAGSSVVVYCWSPGCNAGTKGALAFIEAGYDVKEMIGGYEYWVREGYPAEDASGRLPRYRDPLVSIVASE
ncbi:rhodanese-like domain-containing protein [Microbacterium sp. SORGH_AS_0862]|uniref:rhodanese-like domain-containing protein n=1 Tax=Microbacterium sp. SORGH_AS_0862 TaxID=3041789 RepID=UPI002793AB58|nr:rhodanese-like domain-containing protein [Microbacterium sp. SORGH_AS_0862]MDQ1203766.1 rhodanese-related sulfurtransferase [Microbacterium sp. SORGH_AS_0862]